MVDEKHVVRGIRARFLVKIKTKGAAFISGEFRNSDSNNCGTRQITNRNMVPEYRNREEYNLLGTIHEPYHLCLRNQNVTLLNATSRGAKLSLKNNHERRANFGTKENPNMSVK